MISSSGIAVPHILIPDEKVNMRKWAVVACDQFVYDRPYWESVDKLVGNAPSTLRMMLPETYLNEADVADRIEDTKDVMYDYIEAGVLKELPEGFILVERMIKGRPRLGLMVLLDLEEYEFEPGLKPLIRPTEQTIKNRIPPRMQIRMGAPVEMPHILALIDDPDNTVIAPLYDVRDQFKRLYDFDLMQNGGHITGYFVDDPTYINNVLRAVDALKSHDGMKIAVGDGNHSLATAKEVWNRAKQVLSPEEIAVSPLRYAMCELVNLNDPALDIEPIHRAVVGMSPSLCIQYIVDKLNQKKLGAKLIFSRRKRFSAFGESQMDDSRTIYFSSKGSNGRIELSNLSHVMTLEDLQPVLEQLEAEIPAAHLEYIHGNDKIAEMSDDYDTLCFTLPAIARDEFMDTVVNCGVLPKKCFSLGEENEKRYYLESRLLIIPEDEIEDEPDNAVEEEKRESESAGKHAASLNEEFAEEIAPDAEETAVPTEDDNLTEKTFAEEPAEQSEEPEITQTQNQEPVKEEITHDYHDDIDDLFADDIICPNHNYHDDLDDLFAEDIANGEDPSSVIED